MGASQDGVAWGEAPFVLDAGQTPRLCGSYGESCSSTAQGVKAGRWGGLLEPNSPQVPAQPWAFAMAWAGGPALCSMLAPAWPPQGLSIQVSADAASAPCQAGRV